MANYTIDIDVSDVTTNYNLSTIIAAKLAEYDPADAEGYQWYSYTTPEGTLNVTQVITYLFGDDNDDGKDSLEIVMINAHDGTTNADDELNSFTFTFTNVSDDDGGELPPQPDPVSSYEKVIRGNAHDNHIKDGGKDTRIVGLAGNDTISGGGGSDLLSGGSGNDKLKGGKGDDILKGGSGADTLTGDAGNDILIGGTGGDKFVFYPGSGHDHIVDFEYLADGIYLGVQKASDDFLFKHSRQAGDDTIVTISQHQTITLENFDRDTWDA